MPSVILAASQVPLLDTMPTTLWMIIALSCGGIAIVSIIITLLLWNKHTTQQVGAHSAHTSLSQWRQRIEDVRIQYHQEHISSDQAYILLAEIARDFASERLQTDISAQTLTDLQALERARHHAQGIDLLRQTIAALYPPEFADQQTHALAREVHVDQAAGWVANLVERWKA